MNESNPRQVWFHIFRVSRFPLMWFPIHWKGWLSIVALIAAIIGLIAIGTLLGLTTSHSNILFLAIVIVVVGFQILVFSHSR
jgi:hypothetical protein